jgi:hypothetical protein
MPTFFANIVNNYQNLKLFIDFVNIYIKRFINYITMKFTNKKKSRKDKYQHLKEELFLKKDVANDSIVVFSDRTTPKEQANETIPLAKTFRSLGLDWKRDKGHWAGPYSILSKVNEFLKSYNKVREVIDNLENIEEYIESSELNDSKKNLLIANLDKYIEDLANATDAKAMDAAIKKYFDFWSNFHNYSYTNSLLIYLQKPDAKKVASYNKWKEKGRFPQKGKAIYIWAPLTKRVEDDIDTMDFSKIDDTVKDRRKLIGFKLVPVWDISDTVPGKEGEGEIPETPQWWGDDDKSEVSEKLSEYLTEFAKTLGINLTQSDSKSGEKGFSAGGHINMSSGVEGAAYASTLVHELAHELLHWKKSSPLYVGSSSVSATSDDYLPKDILELHAESVSYLVMKHFNLPCKHHPTYLALWKANADMIKAQLDTITKCASYIIKNVENISEDLNESVSLMNIYKKLKK